MNKSLHKNLIFFLPILVRNSKITSIFERVFHLFIISCGHWVHWAPRPTGAQRSRGCSLLLSVCPNALHMLAVLATPWLAETSEPNLDPLPPLKTWGPPLPAYGHFALLITNSAPGLLLLKICPSFVTDERMSD